MIYFPTRDPWWRFKRYCKLWGLTMLISFITGWLSDGLNGIVICCLTATVVNVIAFAVWEWEERRRDELYRREGIMPPRYPPPRT